MRLQEEANFDIQLTGKISKKTTEKGITEIIRSTAHPLASGAGSIWKRGNPWPMCSTAVYTRVS